MTLQSRFTVLVLLVLVAHDVGSDEPVVAVRGTVQVDGIKDDAWDQAKPVMTAKLVKSLTTLEREKCATASVRWMWNESQLFFLADVADNVIGTKNSNSWAQDSIEIFVDGNLSRAGKLDGDDRQFRFSAMGNLSTGMSASEKHVKFKVVPMTGGYRVEGAIKFDAEVIKAGGRIGLEIQVNNDPGTGQRESICKWADDGNKSWQETSNYGTLIFRDGESNGAVRKTLNEDAIDRKLTVTPVSSSTIRQERVPEWARDAVFYQIFPERFRNGDPGNDPTRATLEFPDIVPDSWTVSPWTQQWYARSPWEKLMGENFYDDGVFHRRYGGDLQGVMDKLDYLVDLGINTLYFNPVFYAKSLHKYDGNSFHHIDPQFGPDPSGDFELMKTETADPATWKWTSADKLFLKLLKAAHDRDLRVIIDGVFNHTGRDFFAFKNVAEQQADSRYSEWYMVESFDDPATDANEFKYKGWWGVDTLPEFANNKAGDDLHPEPKEYIMRATARWMDPDSDGNPDDGIDGWRLDVANEVPNKFWQDWNRWVRQMNPEAYTVAEIWEDAADYLEDCGFSATMNYHGFAFPAKGFLIDGRLSASRFAEMIVDRMSDHDVNARYALQNFYDSHDTDRLSSMIVNARHKRNYTDSSRFDYDVGERVCKRWFKDYDITGPGADDKRLVRLAALFQMTFVGAPMVYYGTEVGMDGADDPDDRMPMVWSDLKYEARTMGPNGESIEKHEVVVDQPLHAYYKQLIELRRRHIALRQGEFAVKFTNDDHGVLVFMRSKGDEQIVVAINRGDSEFAIDTNEFAGLSEAGEMSKLFDSIARGNVSLPVHSKPLQRFQIPARSGQVWQIKN